MEKYIRNSENYGNAGPLYNYLLCKADAYPLATFASKYFLHFNVGSLYSIVNFMGHSASDVSMQAMEGLVLKHYSDIIHLRNKNNSVENRNINFLLNPKKEIFCWMLNRSMMIGVSYEMLIFLPKIVLRKLYFAGETSRPPFQVSSSDQWWKIANYVK